MLHQPVAGTVPVHAICGNGSNEALQKAGSTVYDLYFLRSVLFFILKPPNPVCMVLGTLPLQKHPSKSLSFPAQ